MQKALQQYAAPILGGLLFVAFCTAVALQVRTPVITLSTL